MQRGNVRLGMVWGMEKGRGEGKIAVVNSKRYDRRSREVLIESVAPCFEARVVGPCQVSSPLRLNALGYTTAPQERQRRSAW